MCTSTPVLGGRRVDVHGNPPLGKGCVSVARPNIGQAARSVLCTVRVTPAEEEWMVRKWGTKAKGLRALIDGARGGVVPSRVGPPSAAAVAAADTSPQEVGAELRNPVVVAHAIAQQDGVEQVARHRHRRGAVIRVDWEDGQAIQVYGCQDCEKELR